MQIELSIADATFGLSLIAVIFVVIATLIAFIARAYWLMRVMLGAYIALGLVLAMPKDFFFSANADVIYFFAFTALVAIVAPTRLFEADGDWPQGRIPWKSMFLSFSLLTFFFAVWLTLAAQKTIDGIIASEVKEFFVSQPWFFFWVALPLAYALIVRR